MKTSDIAAKSDKELTTLLKDEQVKLTKLLIESRTQKMSNVKQINAVKKTIARVKTIIREREITQQEAKNA